MYNIDLSFIQSDLIDESELKKVEQSCNDKFQQLIILKGNGEEKIVQDCRCHEGNAAEGEVDNRRIVESLCDGFLGLHYCIIPDSIEHRLSKGDKVLVNTGDSIDISCITETESIVSYKREKCGCANEDLPVIERVATEQDLEAYHKNLADEKKARPIFTELVSKYELNMKLINIHYQFDRKKLYFFYTADGRVDFRQLAKDLAAHFRTRIELRQMGVRDEAKLVGGVGTCGREYCCKSFISNFKRISTQHACDQNLASNLSKLSGPCSKLKCCLSFELEEELSQKEGVQ